MSSLFGDFRGDCGGSSDRYDSGDARGTRLEGGADHRSGGGLWENLEVTKPDGTHIKVDPNCGGSYTDDGKNYKVIANPARK